MTKNKLLENLKNSLYCKNEGYVFEVVKEYSGYDNKNNYLEFVFILVSSKIGLPQFFLEYCLTTNELYDLFQLSNRVHAIELMEFEEAIKENN